MTSPVSGSCCPVGNEETTQLELFSSKRHLTQTGGLNVARGGDRSEVRFGRGFKSTVTLQEQQSWLFGVHNKKK